MNTRFSRLGVVVLLLAVLLVPAIAAAQEPPPAPPEPQWPENEPNDDFFEANDMPLGRIMHGRIDPAGDIDMFNVGVYYIKQVNVEMRLPDNSPLTPVVSLYDGWDNLVAQYECPRSGRCFSYQVNEYSSLYLAVSDGQGAGGLAYEYSILAEAESEVTTDPNEPNDFISEATPYTIGETMTGLMEPQGDIDTFSFHLKANESVVFSGYEFQTLFLNAAGEILDGHFYGYPIYMAPEDGTYYLQIIGGPQAYEFTLRYIQRPIYASFSGAGKLDGVAFKPGDILVYTSLDDTWRMWFRAADYGLKGNLAAFDRHGQSLYLTFAVTQNIPTVGPVAAHDVLSYYPGNPDWGEEPSWTLMFDGSQVGLTTNSERIDALAVGSEWYAGRFYLSTGGKAQLLHGGGQWHIANNDVMAYVGGLENGLMNGSYQALLGGQAAGFGRANVVGLDVSEDGRYLSFDRNLALGGAVFAPGDIALCTPEQEYGHYGCEQVVKIFDASDAGVGGYKIDGIDVGAYQTP